MFSKSSNACIVSSVIILFIIKIQLKNISVS